MSSNNYYGKLRSIGLYSNKIICFQHEEIIHLQIINVVDSYNMYNKGKWNNNKKKSFKCSKEQ